jgi:hypothetical protein
LTPGVVEQGACSTLLTPSSLAEQARHWYRLVVLLSKLGTAVSREVVSVAAPDSDSTVQEAKPQGFKYGG